MQPRYLRFESLVADHGRLMRSAIRRVCGRRHQELVPDIEQETRLALWRRLASDRVIEHPVAYLYKMARSTALQVVRRQRPEVLGVEVLGLEDQGLYEEQPGAVPELEERDRRLVLDQLLARLEPEQARALRAYRVGLSHDEVARLYGWSESVARHRIYRGIARLQKLGKQLVALVLLASVWPWGSLPVDPRVGSSGDPGGPGTLVDEPTRDPGHESPVPASGARLEEAPGELRWPAQPGAWRYRPTIHHAAGEVLWRGPWGEASKLVLPEAVRSSLEAGHWYWTVEVEGQVARPRLGPWVFEVDAPSQEPPGPLVSRVEAGHPAALAGLEPGDHLLGWRSVADVTTSFRALDDPFEVERLLREEALLGAVVLRFARRAEVLERRIEPGRWRLEVALPPESSAGGLHGLWQRLESARGHAAARRFGAAIRGLEQALDETTDATPAHARYRLAVELGEVYYGAQDFAAAERAFRRAAALGRLEEEPGLTLARHHTDLGVVAQAKGDLDTAEAEHRRALELRRRLVPGSVEVAVSLNNLGVVAHHSGDMVRSEALWSEAADLFARSPPDALLASRLWVNLGASAFSRGALDLAEEHWLRALDLRREHAPDTLEEAAAHNNLALVHSQRGTLDAAEDYHQRALELRLELAPQSLAIARSLHNLSEVVRRRGDLMRAASLGRKAVELRLRLAPRHLETGQSLLAQGRLEVEKDDPESARRRFEQGLELLESLQEEGGLDSALALLDLGELERRCGNLESAAAHLARAASWFEEQAPGSLFEARAQRALARLALADPGPVDPAWRAEVGERLARSEGIVRRLAPHSAALAETLGLRAELAHGAGRAEEAERLGLEALAVLDRQESLWGGEEVDRMRFADRFADLYLGVARQILVSDPTGALSVLERYRARRARTLLAAGRPGREETERVSTASTVVDVDGIAGMLEEGTVLLAFLVGEGATLAMALDHRGTVRGSELDVGRRDLEERVRRFEDLVHAPALGEGGFTTLVQRGRRLRELLLAPFADAIASAERLVLVPDGPLDRLPWAALPARDDPEDPRWLVEELPLSVTLSGSVETVLGRSEGRRTAGPWSIFGAPSSVDGGEILAGGDHEARWVGQHLEGAEVYRGQAASEARFRELAPHARGLHFALHGVLDASRPFDSHLVLAAGRPGERSTKDDGRLHAFEVMEELELEAGLVTLAACESRGRSTRGSGPLGLTLAFHLAGARSVLASHWRVADRPTAVLMDHFAAALADGLAKDEALRRAQRALIDQPIRLPSADRQPSWWRWLGEWMGLDTGSPVPSFDARHPYYWAAFVLSGDGASPVVFPES